MPAIVAIGQASYAFAPAVFGIVRAGTEAGLLGSSATGTAVFLLAIGVKVLAIGAFLVGRRPKEES